MILWKLSKIFNGFEYQQSLKTKRLGTKVNKKTEINKKNFQLLIQVHNFGAFFFHTVIFSMNFVDPGVKNQKKYLLRQLGVEKQRVLQKLTKLNQTKSVSIFNFESSLLFVHIFWMFPLL